MIIERQEDGSFMVKLDDGSVGLYDDVEDIVGDAARSGAAAMRLSDEDLDDTTLAAASYDKVPRAEKDLLDRVMANDASALRGALGSGRAPSPEILIVACAYSRVGCVRVLIDAGAPTDVPTKGGMYDGDTALNYALVTGRGDRFPPADPGARPRVCARRSHACDVYADTSPVHAVAVQPVDPHADAYECARIILQHNRSIDPAGFSAKYAMDLWQACMIHGGGKDGMLDVIKLLLDARVDPNVAVDSIALHGMDVYRRPLEMCAAAPSYPRPASTLTSSCTLAPHQLR